ncbi:MAG: hypothetical protein ACE5F5_08740 [Acidimicrobiia bacterium]
MALAACVGGSASPDASTTTLEPIGLEDLADPEVSSRAFAECMTRRGFKATVLENGDVWIDHPNEQREAVRKASDECDQELVAAGITPDPRRPPSEELLRLDYEREVAIVECLAANDYPVSEPPSWDAYLEMRTAELAEEEEIPHWDPLEEVDKTGSEELIHEAYQACVPRLSDFLERQSSQP